MGLTLEQHAGTHPTPAERIQAVLEQCVPKSEHDIVGAMVFNLMLVAAIFSSTLSPAMGDTPAYPDLPAVVAGHPIALIGDLQHTLFWERLIGRESNDSGRKQLVQALHRESPGLLVLLGDMVSWGDSPSKWQDFDSLMAPFLAGKIPMLLAPGNHDYMGNAQKARRNFEERFAQLRLSHWYSRYYNGLGLIWLDSNRDELSPEDWQEQKSWLKQTLADMDRDRSVRAVFVFQHHPPFTNSTVTDDNEAVQADFLPAFLAARKTLAMITGHTHSYEHFRSGGKDFLVTGGGGGPRVSLLKGKKSRHEDLFTSPSPRPLHFLIMYVRPDGVKIDVKGFQSPEPIDSFTLKFAP
ncbi:MAG: metallophosphoesterase [Deltaproteobacteria bacterium]|nr:metallophosphoesterase [Deltaproteobacteria bacterium]